MDYIRRLDQAADPLGRAARPYRHIIGGVAGIAATNLIGRAFTAGTKSSSMSSTSSRSRPWKRPRYSSSSSGGRGSKYARVWSGSGVSKKKLASYIGPSFQTKVITRYVTNQSIKILPTDAASNLVYEDAAGNTLGACLNSIPQGTALDERIGKKIVITAIFGHLRGYIHDPTSATQHAPQSVRVIVYQNKQNNNADKTTGANILELGNDPQNSVFSFRDMNYTDSIKVLKDCVIPLRASDAPVYNTVASATNFTEDQCFYKKIALKGLSIPVSFTSPTGETGATVESNGIYVVMFAGYNNNTGDSEALVHGAFRLHFTG